ncbi:MAG TPA: hypothetical protein VMQ11_00480 [Alphaproteobacteria bacterium]|nr:hypothetical protein [Alphaproteobacteria bacterium]
MMMHESTREVLFGLLELPFLAIAVYFAFVVAIKLQGGAFGRGMQFLAWGFVVMAVGHLHMQIERYTGVNLFDSVLGQTMGDVFWILALVITWGLSAYGFLQIYRAAKG